MGICYSKDDSDESKPELTEEEKSVLSHATKERRAQQRLIENMVHEEFNRDIESVYHTKKTEVLGSGLCGIVRVCIHKQTKIQYALKTLDKTKVKDATNLNSLKNEIRIMALLGHPNIVRLHEYFESPDKIYLVMELCGGGELLEHLNRQHLHKYPEKTACKLVRSVLGAIRYCHEHNIVHRDLKLENFLFENRNSDAELKLIDFGLSQHFQPTEVLRTPVGTPYYVAPEVLSGAYDSKCDIWSIGVIAYMLLSGSPPFHGATDADTLRAVQEGNLTFNQYFNPVSAAAKDFIVKCLNRNVSERPNAEPLQKHEWFTILQSDIVEPMSSEIIDRLRGFDKKSAFSRLCMEVVAHTLTTEQIKTLRKEFTKLDVQHAGEISYDDLRAVLKKQGGVDEDIDNIFREARTGWEHTGKINYHEFVAATISINAVKGENLKLAFEMMSHRKGYITSADIQDLLGKDATQEEVEKMMLEVKFSPSSQISYKDFEKIMREVPAAVVKQGSVKTKTDNTTPTKVRKNSTSSQDSGGNNNFSLPFPPKIRTPPNKTVPPDNNGSTSPQTSESSQVTPPKHFTPPPPPTAKTPPTSV